MRLCGKRLFTPACEDVYLRVRSGGCRIAFFLRVVGWLFFQGFSQKKPVFVWCFCGEVVVSRW
jgi:hypothetical protein